MTILLWFAFIASFTGHYFLTGWLPTVLSDAGASIGEANFAAGLFQVGGAVGSFLIAYLLDRGGIRVVALTFLLAAPIVAALGVISADGPVLLANVFFAGLGVLGGQIGLNALAGTLYPTSMRATGAGWGLGIGRIGSITGPIVGGILITMGMGRPMLFLLTAIPFFFCALALVGLMAAKRRLDGLPENAAAIGTEREFAH
jgi:AAHS family 4-hydroxybenzoate transporter-like MFS transporter